MNSFRPFLRRSLIRLAIGLVCSFVGAYLMLGNAIWDRPEAWWRSAHISVQEWTEDRGIRTRDRRIHQMEGVLEEVEAALAQLDDICRELEAEKASLESSLEAEERAFKANIEQIVNIVDSGSPSPDRDVSVSIRKIRRIREQLSTTKLILAELREQREILQLRKAEAAENCTASNHEATQYGLKVASRRAAVTAGEGCRRVEAIQRQQMER